MIARVTLEIALRREFDYLIPAELKGQVEVGSRVQVPFGPRKVLGVVTALAEESDFTNLKPIVKIIGAQSLVTPKVLKLARWMADYYCCAPEIALKSVLPEAVRREQARWRERLYVRAIPMTGELPKLTKRQQDVWNLIEERRELPLQELLELAETTASTIRRMEDKGLITISSEVSERDPYAHEHIVPTQPLPLNTAQAKALESIKVAMDSAGSTSVSRVASGVPPDGGSTLKNRAISEPTARQRHLPHFEISGRTYHVTWRTYQNLQLTPAARAVTLDACLHWHGSKLKCYIACVMPDHVHLLIQPLQVQEADDKGVHALSGILHSIKSFSAHAANKVMMRNGPVWEDESFDRMIRSESDFHERWNYIWDNPWRSGLIQQTEAYPYMWTQGAVQREAEQDPPEAGATQGVGSMLRQDPRDVGATSSNNSASRSTTFLLHGVTGSGKTEVYLQAIAHALDQGKGAIVLVPEISLTPQTVERFKARFCSGKLQTLVAVLHSHLSKGERHDEWHKIRQGRARIVVGARSAVFAPVDPLGLIIVDEEHEHSYKQEEAPRYHARDLAVLRGQRENAVVVLGSATPSLETYHNCVRNKYSLLDLPERADDKKMPLVRVVDMRQTARKEKGIPIFSPQLKEAITQRLEQKEQTILFLNRRGYSTSLQCPLCGYVAECPNCSVSLTYHRKASKLLCHICGEEQQVPARCPNEKCRNPGIRYAGLGTERVEHTLHKLFPHARVVRMDSDALKRKEDYRRILGDFRTGKIDILVGTQMIAKGLHFPNVTLVGIIYADMALHQADFRAGERTFQLLTQVAGRAGRGDVEGEVFVQAFTPFHPAIQYARRHDYTGFYEAEVEFRKQLGYPPFSRMALITLKGRNEDKVKFTADHLKRELERTAEELRGTVVKGPAPAPLLRAETFYRYQLTLHTQQMKQLSARLSDLAASLQLPEEIRLSIDIDPVDLN